MELKPGQLIEEKDTGSRAIIIEIVPTTSRYREHVRYYLFYVPENPRYNNTIVRDRSSILKSHYRAITL